MFKQDDVAMARQLANLLPQLTCPQATITAVAEVVRCVAWFQDAAKRIEAMAASAADPAAPALAAVPEAAP